MLAFRADSIGRALSAADLPVDGFHALRADLLTVGAAEHSQGVLNGLCPLDAEVLVAFESQAALRIIGPHDDNFELSVDPKGLSNSPRKNEGHYYISTRAFLHCKECE